MAYKYITGTHSSLPFGDIDANPYLTMDSKTKSIDYVNHSNYVIGRHNPVGLKLEPTIKHNTITATYTFLPEHSGPPNTAHGGVLAAVCDDVMGLVCFCLKKVAVTINLNINYLHPVQLNQEHSIKAWLVDINDKKIRCESIIYTQNHTCVEAAGLFYIVST